MRLSAPPDYASIIKDHFEAAVPGIRLKAPPPLCPISGRASRRSNRPGDLWDIYMFGPTIEMFALKDKGGFESFRDYMVVPDVGDESVWEGG